MEKFKKSFPDKVYHGTISKNLKSLKKGINIEKSNGRTDFGKGFYITSDYEQAKKFAYSKTKEHNNSEAEIKSNKDNYECCYVLPLVVEYRVNTKELFKLNGEIFEYPSDKWAEFIYNNRIGINFLKSDYHNLNSRFDFVYGDVADTKLFPTIKKYRTGKITWEEFKKGIEPYQYTEKQYNQLSLHTQEAINCLSYKNANIEVMK